MLCRTANELYWMARHIERAENTARLLDVTYRTSLLPYERAGARARVGRAVGGAADHDRRSPPRTTRRYPDAHRRERAALHDPRRRQPVVDLLLPARGARVGARGARRDHLGDVRGPERAPGSRCAATTTTRIAAHRRLASSCDWVKMRSHLFRGVTFGTMLRDEAYHFIRLGTHLERADNTARILDTKYHILLPSAADVGGAVDYYQWASLLHVGVRVRVLPQDLQRRDHAAARRRAPDPARRHAALAARLHEPHRRDAASSCATSTARARAAGAASCTRGCTTAAPTTSSRFGLHEYLMDFLRADLARSATRSARTSSSRRY